MAQPNLLTVSPNTVRRICTFHPHGIHLLAFHCITSMFGKHIKFPQEKPIPGEFWPLFTDVPQPEPVWYQVVMQGQIKFIIIMVEQLSRSSIDVYTRLFTELYTASRYNTESDDGNRMPSDYSRVHGLLTDRPAAHFSFFSYDPFTSTFQTDEDLYVNPSSTTAPRDMAKVTEKFLSILMYAYNELLDDRRSHTDLVPKEHQVHWISTKTHNAPRSLSDALEEAAQYAKSATEILKQPANKDALIQGLDFVSESIRVLPLCEDFDSSWSRYTTSLREEGATWREICTGNRQGSSEI
ncbi:uncharacterized protein EV420DRAFT_1585969 [Desarmillaria tabescens]|uniref:Uncharacterized protein n=1 Tax=Armillaria tabescens TaxID=1929756 RepID=A0AA39J8Y9_ARMTA|nr:uncharacterized protein EV420DRAFT_1585969 [Desarmillaria tabescens]KAK0438351.1 hypothetical protein EV420DRAFT_1585969 [Desarmillaria tabescens]